MSDAPATDSASAAGCRPAGSGRPLRPIRSFTLRRGRATQAQKEAYEHIFPRLSLRYAAQPLDFAIEFGRDAPVVLEIGFGMGETTAAIAVDRPDVDFIGVEVFAAGIGALARRIEDLGLRNLRMVQHDAVEVARNMLAPNSLAGVHIYFPDPWPKKRHHKRRLVAPKFAELLAGRIKPGGYLHCATDWQPYAEQMLAVLTAETQLVNAHAGFAPAARNPLTVRPSTKFQARAERLGHGVWDLVFLRR